MSQPAPSPRKARWRHGVLLGAVALLALLIAGAVVFRTQIATALATAYLEAQGVAVRSLAVTRLTFDAVEVTELSLGEARELTAARVVLEPVFDGLEPGLDALRVEGLQLDVDLTGADPPLGSLQPALEHLAPRDSAPADGEPVDHAALALPRIVIEDGTLRFDTAVGTLTASLEGSLTSDGGRMALLLPGETEHLELTASARRDPAASDGTFAVELDGELRTGGALARLLALPGPAITAGTLVVEVAGEASPDDSRVALRGDALLGGAALADGTEGISAHLPLAVEVAGGRATVTLTEEAVARVERPSRDSLRALGVPEDLLPLLASGVNLTLAANGETPFRLTATPPWPPQDLSVSAIATGSSDQGLALALEVEGDAALAGGRTLAGFDGSLTAQAEAERLAIGGREARGLAITLPVTVDYGGDGLHLALARAGALRIDQFGAGTPLQLKAPLDFVIEGLELATTAEAKGYSYSLAAREEGAAFTVAAAGTEPVSVDAGALRLQLDGRFTAESGHSASLAARLGSLDLPGHGFTTEDAEIEVTLDRDLRPALTRFALGPFQLVGDQPLTAPLALAGNLERAGAGYDLAGALTLPGGRTLVDLTGRYHDDGRARLEAESRLISFAPDGLQPVALSPLLADLQDVRGNLSASASLAWPREPTRESGRISLGNLSFKSGGTAVEGLDLLVEFDSLLPLASAAGQRLTVRRLEAGVPVSDIEVVFSLDQAPRPNLDIEDGRFELGGGRWRIEPTEIDPAAARNRVVLATEGLDLAAFFDLIDIEGLSGSGTLAGTLPVVFAGNDVIVDNGHFDALGPGRLSIRFQALRSALAGGGEVVEAAAKALEDFRYEELSLSIAKTADNDATVKLSTLGKNPEVMEGQPFRFNINLESNLTSVLEALAQGYRLSDDALRRAWRLRE